MIIKNEGDPLEINDIGITLPTGVSSIKDYSDEITTHLQSGRLILLDGDGNPVPIIQIDPENHIHNWKDIVDSPSRFPPLSHEHKWVDIVDPPNMSGMQLFHVQGRRDKGKHGGTFSAGARRVRELNTVLTNEIKGANLLQEDQFELPPGRYWAYICAPAVDTRETRTWLRDVKAVKDVLIGLNHSADDPRSSVCCIVKGIFVLEETTLLEVQQRCRSTQRDYGFGIASGFDIEIYTDVEIWKLS